MLQLNVYLSPQVERCSELLLDVAQGEGAKVIFASEYWGESILKQVEFPVIDDFFTGMSRAAKRNNVPYVDIYKIMARVHFFRTPTKRL